MFLGGKPYYIRLDYLSFGMKHYSILPICRELGNLDDTVLPISHHDEIAEILCTLHVLNT